MSDQPLDQTTFVESALLRDEASTPVAHTTIQPQPDTSQIETNSPTTQEKKTTNKKKIPHPLFFVFGMLLLLILVLVIIFSLPRTNTTSPTNPIATSVPSIGAPV